MAKKEYKIGETFSCYGVRLRCEKQSDHGKGCRDCFFYKEGIDCTENDFSCVPFSRTDETDVVFVKVEE